MREDRKNSCWLLIASIVFIAVFSIGWYTGVGKIRETAIKEGHAEYVLSNPTTGETVFKWKDKTDHE